MQCRNKLCLCIVLMCLFSYHASAEYSFTAVGFMGNGMAEQSNNGFVVSSIIGQPVIGYSTGDIFALSSGFGFILNEIGPVIEQLAPPLNFHVSDVPNDNGHFLKLNWEKSLSESLGLVSWYLIFRSRNGIMTDPIPISTYTSIDSVAFYEQFYTLLVDSVTVGSVEYTDFVPINGVTYYYWLQAVGTQGASAKITAGFITMVQDAPVQFHVSQPYPNPFNPSTTIALTLPKDTRLMLSIFNVSGQRVAVLANEKIKAGKYSFLWNATGMPSGVYLCRVQIEHASEMKKVLLLK